VFTLDKTTKTTVKQLIFYEGRVLGYVDGRNHFQPTLDATESLDFLANEVDVGIKIHLRSQAPGLYRLAQHHNLRPRDYITPYEAGLWAAEHARNKEDLRNHACVAWRMLHRLGLENKVFPQLQPA